STGNLVQGNFIGTDLTGTKDLGNLGSGIYASAPDNTIGGATPGAGNVISGNDKYGVIISGSYATGNLVQGNFIGTDLTGTKDLGNLGSGVFVIAPGNTIGGATAGARNIISGNLSAGILISGLNATGNLVQGNFIGTDASGALPLPNQGFGVELGAGASNNLIGGPPISATVRGPSNVIAFNTKAGIFVDASSGSVNAGIGNMFSGNSIFSNLQLGIDIAPPGPNTNITGGSTSGPNDLQNYPILDFVFFLNNATNVLGRFNSLPGQTYRIEFFASSAAGPLGHGQGQTYLGFTDVTTDAQGNALLNTTLPLPPTGQTFIAATATAANGSTSEFSSTLVIGPPPVDLGVVKTGTPDPVLVRGLLTYTINVTNSGPGTARNVTLLDTLPTGVYFVSATTSQGTIDSQPTSARVLTAQLGDLPAGGLARVQIIVRPMIPGTILNTVNVASQSPEINPENNTAYRSTEVLPVADLVVTLNAAPQPVFVGDLLTFTTTITNQGPSTAKALNFAEALLGGAQVVSVQSSRGPISIENDRIEETFDSLDPLESIVIVLVVRLTGPDVQFVRASVNSQTFDPNPANNAAEVAVNPLLFTVTNTNDAGQGSLRQAILNTNLRPDRNLINFAIPGQGPFTISPITPLPSINYPVILDAQTQPGFQSRPIIELSGARLGVSSDGMVILAGQSTVRGLIVNRFRGNGIALENQGGNLIEGNILGTNANGAPGLGNGAAGLVLIASANNIIGGNGPIGGNVISG
ncbi:MAG: DUF11 domain-containing protein, partial [Isosphaeraceae bacterium]